MKTAYAACPLCGSPSIAPLREAACAGHPLHEPRLPRTLRWMRCADCAHVHTDGYWTPEALAIIFRAANPHQVVGWDFEGQRYLSARMVERVMPHRSSGRWLDVGFGNAALLFAAREFGFEAEGLDLREANVAALRAQGMDAHREDIATFRPTRPFDVISMMDVLEHMPFPRVGLEAARRLLAPGGVLYVSMPNSDCDAWRMLDAAGANPYWGEIEHYHNFGRARLHALLREHGFEPVRYAVSERYRVCMEVIARRD